MKARISPDLELVYTKLIWVERRRFRIRESVAAHFGHAKVEKILTQENLLGSPLEGEPTFAFLLDERPPLLFLSELAGKVERLEAATVKILRQNVSVYREHVDEQILFGARTAGQEAGRAFLARAPTRTRFELSVPETVQAIFDMDYSGLPGEKNYFLCLRPHGGATVHFARSPHLEAWGAAGGDPAFLYDVRCQWVQGNLDILSPEMEFSTAQAIERGSEFGLEHFYLRDRHAGL